MQNALEYLAAPLFALLDFALDAPVPAAAIASLVASALGFAVVG